MKLRAGQMFWALALVAVGISAWLLLRPGRIPVHVAVAGRGFVEQFIEEEGETRVVDRYTIAAPVTGRLRRVSLREGDTIASGQTAAIIEPAPLDARAYRQGVARLEAALDAERIARAELEGADENVEQAKRDRDRTASMSTQGLAAPAEREKSELALITARKQLDAVSYRVKVAAHEVEEARAAIAARPDGTGVVAVVSPVSGRVLHRFEESERVVLAGTAILEVADVRGLEVVVDLLSTDAVRVAPGDTVEVVDWGGDSTLVATVGLVEPSGFTKVSALGVEEQRVNVVASLSNPPANLGDRFRVGVRIVLWRSADVLRVSRGAVFREGGEWHGFVVEAGRVRDRRISVGHVARDYVEILGNLQPGDQLVVYPDERIRDGVRVVAVTTP